ncbi:M9 family metallopeptidase [Myxococcus sp. K38C18041901]|uniref:M9 family metallopeptidase n=1 Tax=Myxococcus guangdongensis TaxID=2906760 RepID=UPI0020A77492|nr:M9 family metallopeptidase [Myxococcus guangdongensis]MCP3058883.1 M9 family metallopeptidase [Myxococcus guangdongensis]
MCHPVTNGCRYPIVLAICLAVSALGADARPSGPSPAGAELPRHGLEQPRQRPLPEESPPSSTPSRLACDTAAFGAASGAALVTLVEASTQECLRTLFDVTGTLARQVFIESKMITVANALTPSANAYAGDTHGTALPLMMFLRAGYFVQSFNPIVGTYGTALRNAIRPALAAFVANSHFQDVNDEHGVVLREFVTLIDSSGETPLHLGTFQGLLDRFDDTTLESWYMYSATSKVFTGLSRGHHDAAFIAAVRQDDAILGALDSFVQRTEHLLGTYHQDLTIDAARELARFIQYPGALQDKTRPMLRALIANHPMTGPTAVVWVNSVEAADIYDGANCAYYGICDFRRTLAQAVLPKTFTCGAVRMRAQDMTTEQSRQTCARLSAQATYFHDMLGRVPVAGDNNTTLELVIFDSSLDYQLYAGLLFDIDTDNGGIYREGNPSASDNQARFITYEEEQARPAFQVSNLEREYVHYLDGRFDMSGDLQTSISQPTRWWIEGLAEYFSKKNDNAGAVAVGAGKAFQLSQILRNDDNSGTERLYTWGYLAVRFMFERHVDRVNTFLGHFRAGNYAAYRQSLDALGTAYDTEFHAWLTCVATASDPSTCANTVPPPEPGTGTPCTASDPQALGNGCYRGPLALSNVQGQQSFYLVVPSRARNLRIQLSGGTGNADLYVNHGIWPTATTYDYRPYLAGNDEAVVIPSPRSGYFYIMLKARQPYTGVKVEARFDTGP